jgi:hypothetical protein
MKRILFVTVALTLTWTLVASAQAASLSADEIFERTRNAWRGESFHGTLELENVLSSGQTKSFVLEAWTLGDDLTLVRIHEPAEDAGSGYLDADGKLWYYSPILGSAVELPSIALSQALFGSGPSLDDLSHGTLSDDYDAQVSAADDEGYSLTLIPHDDAPVVYGKLVIDISPDFVIHEIIYYDQRDAVLRTTVFTDVIEVDGNRMPTTVESVDANGDRTVHRVVDPEFDLDIDESFFTLETLTGEAGDE